MPKTTDLAKQLREAIAESGLNRFRLSKLSGVRYAAVHGFVGGDRDLTLNTAAKLCRVLGLELRAVPKRRGSTARKGR